MISSRRAFIRQTATLGAAALFSKNLFAEIKSNDHITGIQLYTVRDDMQKNAAATLKHLAAIGYRYVEHAGYANRKFYGYTSAEFKKLLNDTGLIMQSGHNFLGAAQWNKASNDFTDSWKYIVEDAAAVGMKYVISPGVDESLCTNISDFTWYMQLFNKCGEFCKKSGLTFAYHNESFEFTKQFNNKNLYEIILSSADPELVGQQMDIGNMYAAGGRPIEYLRNYPGRFKLMHVKDEIKTDTKGETGGGYDSTTLGQGLVGVKEVVTYAQKTGTSYFIVEQESYQNRTPLQCAKENLMKMKSWKF